jgi:GGDEF domain-containing protein
MNSVAHWNIIHSLPSSKATLLQSFLAKKFPTFDFLVQRFDTSLSIDVSKSSGAILELKDLKNADLKVLDKLWRRCKSIPTLAILTPQSYQLMKQRRPEFLADISIILSDLKSLDYIPQIPRWIDSASRRNRLKSQNERLKRLMAKAFGALDEIPDQGPGDSREFAEDLVQGIAGKPFCGLRVSLRRWNGLKKKLGAIGHREVIDSIGRMINSAVRNSDRVLHWKEDEFLIFLSNTEPKNLKLCQSRVEQLLSSFTITADQRKVSVPFSVKTVEQMAFFS